jgi:hypothetical protein
MKTRIALSTEANKTLPIDAHFAELRLVAPGQGEAPDEPADETPVRLLGDRRVDDQQGSDKPTGSGKPASEILRYV